MYYSLQEEKSGRTHDLWPILLFYLSRRFRGALQPGVKRPRSVLGWRQPVRLLEVSREMTLIGNPNSYSYLFDAQRRGLKKLSRFF